MIIYHDKIYLYSKNLEQEKYTHLLNILERIAEVNILPIDQIFHSSNEEIIPIREMEDRDQTVVMYDDYVCEKNQTDIIKYLIILYEGDIRTVAQYIYQNHIIRRPKI